MGLEFIALHFRPRRRPPQRPEGRGRMIIAIASITMTSIIISTIMSITVVVVTIDVASGLDRVNP